MSLHFKKPGTYLITKGEATNSNYAAVRAEILAVIGLAVELKVDLVQIREKHISGRLLFDLAAAAVNVTRGSDTKLLVNDRPDVAVAAGADGVHLAGDSLPVEVVRRTFPAGLLIGVSTHSLDQVLDAAASGADFAVFGPIFETPGKGKPTGIEDLRSVCSSARPFRVFALGGIDGSNFKSVLAAGASGIAAIRSLNEPEPLKMIMSKLLN